MSTFDWKSLRDIPHEFIITIGSGVLPSDLELFFSFNLVEWKELDKQGITLTHYIHFDDDIQMEDLAVALEHMPSKNQARKNNWGGPIPDGYSEFKRKFHRFYILKLLQPLD